MLTYWTLNTNAKSSRNTEVLFNKLSKYFDHKVQVISIKGDRYSGHRLHFCAEFMAPTRGVHLPTVADGRALGQSLE